MCAEQKRKLRGKDQREVEGRDLYRRPIKYGGRGVWDGSVYAE